MPLFSYKCLKCDFVVEKFQHKPDQIDIECAECKNTEFERIFGTVHNKIWLNARDTFNNVINPDAERIRRNVASGNDKDFLDISGD